jgi:hypothetical protein
VKLKLLTKKIESDNKKIEGLGIQFLRFNDLGVKRNMPGVLSVIEQWVEEHTPDPSQEGNYPPPRRFAPPFVEKGHETEVKKVSHALQGL